MMKQTKGFSLIELMIVVAIIGILSAIGLPAYQDYTVRARASELLMAATPAKHRVAERMILTGEVPGDGFTVENVSAGMVNGITWDQGRIEIEGNAAELGESVTLFLAPTLGNAGSIVWQCGAEEGGRFAPSSCRDG